MTESADASDADPPPLSGTLPAPALPVRSEDFPTAQTLSLPAIIERSGPEAMFGAQEFFLGTIRNEYTQRAYLHAIKRFLAWVENTAAANCGRLAPGMWAPILRAFQRP